MPRFAANLTMLFNEVDFTRPLRGRRRTPDSSGVEYLFPYDYPADRLAELLSEHGLTQVPAQSPCRRLGWRRPGCRLRS